MYGDLKSGTAFQSTLPRGSEAGLPIPRGPWPYFNPRSLAGASTLLVARLCNRVISIHAPSRERVGFRNAIGNSIDFNPRSLAGANVEPFSKYGMGAISIHAPSRERLMTLYGSLPTWIFQSTLPRGSEDPHELEGILRENFNPRSLAGAINVAKDRDLTAPISIHAPSRERAGGRKTMNFDALFQSTLPRGSESSGRLPDRKSVV